MAQANIDVMVDLANKDVRDAVPSVYQLVWDRHTMANIIIFSDKLAQVQKQKKWSLLNNVQHNEKAHKTFLQ